MNRDEAGFIEQWLYDKKNVRLTDKGRRWAFNVEGAILVLGLFAVIALVGFVEGYGNP